MQYMHTAELLNVVYTAETVKSTSVIVLLLMTLDVGAYARNGVKCLNNRVHEARVSQVRQSDGITPRT